LNFFAGLFLKAFRFRKFQIVSYSLVSYKQNVYCIIGKVPVKIKPLQAKQQTQWAKSPNKAVCTSVFLTT